MAGIIELCFHLVPIIILVVLSLYCVFRDNSVADCHMHSTIAPQVFSWQEPAVNIRFKSAIHPVYSRIADIQKVADLEYFAELAGIAIKSRHNRDKLLELLDVALTDYEQNVAKLKDVICEVEEETIVTLGKMKGLLK